MDTKSTRRGFTLIELLVVVLIIGILAAVAVPQYQKAVIKSRFSTLKALTKSLSDAEEVYYLANGAYTGDMETLGVMPAGKLNTSTTSQFDYSWGRCGAHMPEPGAKTAAVYCMNSSIQMQYEIYLKFSPLYAGWRKCSVQNASGENDIKNQICKQETGASTYASAENSFWWTYQ